MHRRTLLGGLGALGLLGACGEDAPVRRSSGRRLRRRAQQYAELYLPGRSTRAASWWSSTAASGRRGTTCRSAGRSPASLAERGWAAWNLEYRRVGNGGGAPATFDDVAAGIDALADVDDLDLATVITLGHSAGGHLAAWAASRGRTERWQPERVAGHRRGLPGRGAGPARRAPTTASAAVRSRRSSAIRPARPTTAYDPIRQVPLDVPVWCEHGRADDTVPISQSVDYVAAAKAAGAEAGIVEFDGDHFVVIEPGSEVWARQLELLEQMT